MRIQGEVEIMLRFAALALLAWLALPIILCGWLLYGCWRLLAGVHRLLRPAAVDVLSACREIKRA